MQHICNTHFRRAAFAKVQKGKPSMDTVHKNQSVKVKILHIGQTTVTRSSRFAGWSAYASALATILSFVAIILFFSGSGLFGTINDIFSVFQVLFMLPLTLVFYRLSSSNTRMLNIVGAMFGVVGMITVAVGQSLLVVGMITYQQSLSFVPAGAAIGIWLLLVDFQALSSRVFPRRLALTGILAGIGYLVTVVGFLFGGQESPVFYGGGLILVVSYPIWAIWLARECLLGKFLEFAAD
jgi:hypothetical protein